MKRALFLVASFTLILTNFNAFAATPKVGDSCPQLNKSIKVGSQTYICTKSSNSLKWQIQKKVAVAKTISGQKCTQINQTRIFKGYQYSCIKKGKNLVWSYDTWALPRKLLVVAFTPKDRPDFWNEKPTLNEFSNLDQIGNVLFAPSFDVFGTWTWRDFLDDSIQQTMAFWKESTDGKIKFDEPEVIYAPPGTSKPVSDCNLSADTYVAMKYMNSKTIPKGTHLVSVNPFRKCNYEAGLAVMDGHFINLIGIYALTHEFGHNLGFRHSATLNCTNNDFKNLTQKNCQEAEYGDTTDVMGEGNISAGCRVSATSGHVHLNLPDAKEAKIGETVTVTANTSTDGNILYRIRLDNIWFFFEYRSLSEGKDSKDCYFSGESGIEVRLIGDKWPNQNLYLVERFADGEGRTQTVSGNITTTFTTGVGILRFTSGETFLLPGLKGKYSFTVLTVEPDKATFKIEKVA